MSHETIRRTLGPYIEGELGARERARVERHLESCVDCLNELSELRSTIALLRALPDPPQPPGLADAVVRRLHEEHARRSSFWSAFARTLRGPVPVATAACGLLVFTLVRSTSVTLELHPADVEPSAPQPSAVLAARSDREAAPEVREPAPIVRPMPRARPIELPLARPPVLAGNRLRHVSTGAGSPLALRSQARSVLSNVAAFEPSESRSALPPLPELALCQGMQVSSRGTPTPAEVSCRPWLAGMLTLAQYDLRSFVRQLHELPMVERDAWIDQLARYATGSGVAPAVAARLRAASEPWSMDLAERFDLAGHTRHD